MTNKIQFYRKSIGLSQNQLAEKMQVSQKRISQLENSSLSSRVEPSLSEIIQLLNIFDCNFEDLFEFKRRNEGMEKGVLIKYTHRGPEHVDPDFTYLVYGDSGKRAVRLKNIVDTNTIVFFHTNIGGSDYITGYFKVAQILHKGQDDKDIIKLKSDAKKDEIIILGDRDESKILISPLLFDKGLALKLKSLNIEENYFDGTSTELMKLNSKTREHRELSPGDTKALKQMCIGRG
ncbi:helix-turn-helix domain-containing protein (plasmid) [Bacillus wiedmannii]|uniref:helix-turn-helix domain-containing protein n=1 Tax=Bacillus wiedmannii TaxID=1890302 RepID=UPI00065B7BCD|nr:helix-turn-helix domain-containing protein [Bacillus wiedmannii]KMP74550.1 DNA-binding protein [Bacillus cereus]WMS85312.1 helix-turn-helix domain-containing protein [Bacillus wiedmannii]